MFDRIVWDYGDIIKQKILDKLGFLCYGDMLDMVVWYYIRDMVVCQ